MVENDLYLLGVTAVEDTLQVLIIYKYKFY